MHGTVTGVRPVRIQTVLGEYEAEADPPGPAMGEAGWILLRPGGGSLRRGAGKAVDGIRGVVVETVRRGEAYRIRLRTANGFEVLCMHDHPVDESEERIWKPGPGVWIRG